MGDIYCPRYLYSAKRLGMQGMKSQLFCENGAAYEGVDGISLLRLVGPCVARVFGRQGSFSQAACAAWTGDRLPFPCFPIRLPRWVWACSMTLALHHDEINDTWALREPAPFFPGSRWQEPCGHSRRAICSIATARFSSRCLPVRVSFPAATHANGLQ